MRATAANSVAFLVASIVGSGVPGVVPRQARAAAPDRIIPTVVSAPAAGGGTWRTMLVAHNPSEEALRFDLTFHPAGSPAASSDPKDSLSLAAGESTTVEDLLRDRFGLSRGSGSVDVLDVEGRPAVLDVRVTRDAPGGGRLGLSVPVVTPSEA